MHENSGKKELGVALGLLAGLILGTLALSDAPFVITKDLFSQKADTADSQVIIIRHGHETDLGPQALHDPQSPAQQPLAEVPVRVADRQGSSDPAATPVKDKQLLVQIPSAPESLSPVVPPPRDLPEDDPDTLLNHARFLIKAGLAPIAREPLEKVVKKVPGTPIAREAQRTLDSISRN